MRGNVLELRDVVRVGDGVALDEDLARVEVLVQRGAVAVLGCGADEAQPAGHGVPLLYGQPPWPTLAHGSGTPRGATGRLRLLPVYDDVVRCAVGRPAGFWLTLRAALREDGFRPQRELLASYVAGHLLSWLSPGVPTGCDRSGDHRVSNRREGSMDVDRIRSRRSFRERPGSPESATREVRI
ncbi:DUF6308 family protein [Actinacidiphila soli]|uniref:DUF6308 family protein n=1 Tax=Actinacidiphila soli TaxID=2487275 RepID=UPI001F0B80FD|nr:DUF6308 family protein [Actinacidiphila soli]